MGRLRQGQQKRIVQSYESLGPSPGRNGAGIFDFVPGARSRFLAYQHNVVYIFGHVVSNADENWYLGRGR